VTGTVLSLIVSNLPESTVHLSVILKAPPRSASVRHIVRRRLKDLLTPAGGRPRATRPASLVGE